MSTEIRHAGCFSAADASSTKWLRRDFTRFTPPQLNFTPCRWATTRTRNVEEIAQQWTEDPSLAYVFNDPKLGGNELVLFRKQILDMLLTPLLELNKGRAAIQLDISVLGVNVAALKHNLKSLTAILDSSSEVTGDATKEAVLAALETVNGIELTIHAMAASVVVANPQKTEIASLTEDEESLAREILEEEGEDDE